MRVQLLHQGLHRLLGRPDGIAYLGEAAAAGFLVAGAEVEFALDLLVFGTGSIALGPRGDLFVGCLRRTRLLLGALLGSSHLALDQVGQSLAGEVEFAVQSAQLDARCSQALHHLAAAGLTAGPGLDGAGALLLL